MLHQPIDVLHSFPIRKSRKQKTMFLESASDYFRRLGYDPKIETGSFRCRNLVVGDPEQASCLVTAHYDTCAAMIVPNFITPCNLAFYILYQILLTAGIFAIAGVADFLIIRLVNDPGIAILVSLLVIYLLIALLMFGPANRHNANDNTSGVVSVLTLAGALPEADRSSVCFVLFDLEEAGLIGSGSYRKKHKNSSSKQLVLNLDCVGEGDTLLLFPSKAVKKDEAVMAKLESSSIVRNEKRIGVYRGFAFYPSDQAGFPKGIGIAALKHNRLLGLYMDKIHTARDRVLEEENVMLLRDYLLRVIGGQPK